MKKLKEKNLFMNIKDKIICEGNRVCPPHYFPHKLPFGKPITNEPCHFHHRKWGMWHHILFCKYLKCPNFKSMMKSHKNKK